MIRFNPFDRREKFLVLLVTVERTSALLFAVTRDRLVNCEKFWPDFKLDKVQGWWSKVLPRWTILVAASPNLAYTADVPVRLERSEADRDSLTPAELENLLGRGLNQEFVRYRTVASRSLGVSDLDTVLADSRVVDFKIDGHRVYNPVGFSPRHLEATIEMTFTQRALYDSLHQLTSRHNSFFTSLSAAKLTVLRKVYETPFILAVLESPRSTIFRVQNKPKEGQGERQEIAWSAKEFLQVCINSWGVNEEIARDLLAMYKAEQLPQPAATHLKKEFSRILDRLERFLKANAHQGKVLITNQEDIPLTHQKLRFEKISLPRLLEQMGFTASGGVLPIPEYEQFSYLAPLLAFFSDQDRPEMSRWLRRRLHWLGSMNYN